jgi:hypothetical protein
LLIDERDPEPGAALGRTVYDEPELDGLVSIARGVVAGQPFARVRISAAGTFDLPGEVVPWHTR